MLFPTLAKDGVKTPKVFVDAVKLHVPPAGLTVNVREDALEHIVLTGVIVGLTG